MNEPQQKSVGALPEEALYWLVLAELLVVLPHLFYLPIWILGLEGLCLAWWFGILKGRIAAPKATVKLLLILVITALLYFSQGRLTGLDAAAALLICALILKSLEIQAKRDAWVMIFLGFFSVITGYLFEASLAHAAYSLLPILALLVALLSLQPLGHDMRTMQRIRLSGVLLLQALPLMLVLFLFVPRLPPLWSMPQPQEGQTLGLSDQLSPNTLNELTRSAAPAFRVQFDGKQPAQDSLYWRGISFEYFDGVRWSRSGAAKTTQTPVWSARGEPLDYTVIQQPSAQPWLFALDVVEHPSARGVKMMGDFHLESVRPIAQPLMYQLRSWPEAQAEPHLASPRRTALLQLPTQGNPRTRALAETLKRQYSEPKALVSAVLQKFSQEAFAYSLKSTTEGQDAIDQFLFDHRSGFCAHYAQAMTFLLRAAGVPARVVGGYQGGRYNPEAGYWLIRQFDAHAWLEYWVDDEGWQRADPTFQVAPERIQLGVEQALEQVEQFLPEASEQLRGQAGLGGGWPQLYRMWDEWEYAWQRWVLNYQAEQQGALFQQLLGFWRTHQLHLGYGLLGMFAGLLGLQLFRRHMRRCAQNANPNALLHRYDEVLQALGCSRLPHEGLRGFSERAASALPQAQEAILTFARAYEATHYANEVTETHRRNLLRALKQLRRAQAQAKRRS